MPAKAILNENEICKEYLEGESFKNLSSKHHTDSHRIRKILIKNNIKIRGYGHHLAKYFPDDYDPNNKDYIFIKKKCVKCGTDKLLSEFHLSKKDALGVKPICKQCRHEMKDIESAKRTKNITTIQNIEEKQERHVIVARKQSYTEKRQESILIN